ncbi:MAG TPA: FlgD immunoglobulin-like domain containing protein, partial [bacterium]|nr:FlgD immunoglobulin-like domain containing protein [bacterium]
PEQKAARILAMKVWQLGTGLYGCDLLEVGYRWRHGIQLAGHLDLWDTLTGNGLFVTGIGTSDTHGTTPFYGWSPWIASATYENNFVTWFWAPTLSRPDVLEALDAGRAYFGDPYYWQGDLDLATLDGFPMGRVVVTDQPSHDVRVLVNSVTPTTEIRFLQMEIRDEPGYHQVNVLRDELLPTTGGAFLDTVTVDTTLPSFVRIEVTDSGEEWAYSNPVHFLRSFPSSGIAANRAAVRLDDVRLLSARGLVLRDAQLVPSPAELTLELDEETPGLGEAVLDCGARGEPGAVIGAAAFAYDDGLLTLNGFAGTGSTVRVLWGPVAAGEPRPAVSELALAPGRPNPFGAGLVTELALPEPAQVLVEVMDVRGRRLRILLDERRGAGRHRVAWDGTDPYGRPVADGVYFLRLSALGRTLTTKAVKLR